MNLCYFTVSSNTVSLLWITKGSQNFHPLLVGVWNGTITLKNCLGVSNKIKIHQHYTPEIPLLTVYLRELYVYVRKPCAGIFTAVLLVIDKNRTQPKYPSAGAWLHWFTQVLGYHLKIQKNEPLIHWTHVNLKDIIWAEGYTLHAFLYVKF